jgi:hypothetical protein
MTGFRKANSQSKNILIISVSCNFTVSCNFKIQLYAWQFIWDKHKGIAASLTAMLEC